MTDKAKRDSDPGRLEYVPPHYHPTFYGNIVIWGENGSELFATTLVQEGTEKIERLLNHRLKRTLHVVVYASNKEACRALGRDVAPAALLAPLHQPGHALVALQAPIVDPRNGDPRRMQRHICHELAHVFAAERTNSVKRLGDEDRGMHLLSWVNEGFAENVAASSLSRPEIVHTALRRLPTADMANERLETAFRALDAPERKLAFAVATVRVWRALETHGYRFVFENLSCPEKWACT